jgi:hypothetical protein
VVTPPGDPVWEIDLFPWPSLSVRSQQEAYDMSQKKRSRRLRDLSPVHPTAAAIDIGATMHVAAVGPNRDKEPVQTFRTFTADLHRLADWFSKCGVKTVAMESTGVYWIPVFEILG